MSKQLDKWISKTH